MTNEKSFTREIFDLFYFDLLAFSRPIVADEQAAEDVGGKRLPPALGKNRKTLGNINNLSAYLYTATKYASINYLKARKNTADVAIDELDDSSLYSFSTPETSMIGKENVLSIEKAINQLIAHHSIVFEPKKRLVWVSTAPWRWEVYLLRPVEGTYPVRNANQ